MDDGLIQILVIAFFIVISLMDGAARKKRKEQERQAQLGGLDDPESGGAESTATASERTSEGLVPAELWEEIAALARGEPPPSSRRASEDDASTGDSGSVETAVQEPEESWLDPAHQRVERHHHVEWDPEVVWEPDAGSPYAVSVPSVPERVRISTRSPSPPRVVSGDAVTPSRYRALHPDLSEPGLEAPYGAVDPAEAFEVPTEAPGRGAHLRSTLMGEGLEGVRRAIVLSEVLGPPLALREVDREPWS